MEHITNQLKKYQRNRLFQEQVEKCEGASKFSVIQQRSLFDTKQTEGFYLLLGFYCSYFSKTSLILFNLI